MNDHNQNAEGEFGHVDKVASLLGGLHVFHHCLGLLGSSYGSLKEGFVSWGNLHSHCSLSWFHGGQIVAYAENSRQLQGSS